MLGPGDTHFEFKWVDQDHDEFLISSDRNYFRILIILFSCKFASHLQIVIVYVPMIRKSTSSLAVAVTYADLKNSAEIQLVARPVTRTVHSIQERI